MHHVRTDAEKPGIFCQVRGFAPIRMMECWNNGIMGSGIMQCWVNGGVCADDKTKNG